MKRKRDSYVTGEGGKEGSETGRERVSQGGRGVKGKEFI